MVINIVEIDTGRKYAIDLEDSIAIIKAKVEAAGGPPINRQRLVVNGKEADDATSWSKYGFSEGTAIHLIKRLG